MAERSKIDILAMRGSGAGAFGYPQFLPTSYLRYGADGNGDGRIRLDDMDDAAASCARFLAQNGWRPGLSWPSSGACSGSTTAPTRTSTRSWHSTVRSPSQPSAPGKWPALADAIAGALVGLSPCWPLLGSIPVI